MFLVLISNTIKINRYNQAFGVKNVKGPKTYSKEKTVSDAGENWISLCRRMKLDPISCHIQKSNQNGLKI